MKPVTTIFKVLIVVVAIAAITVSDSYGQFRYGGRKRSKPYIGFETSVGTQTFTMKSNLPEYNNLKLYEEGYNIGVFAGGNGFLVKLRNGFYKADLIEKSLPVHNFQTTLNVFPLHYTRSKNEFAKPYVVLGIEKNTFEVSALVTPKPKQVVPPTGEHECGELPGDPEQVETPVMPALPELRTGNFSALRMIAGTGVQVRIEKKRFFVNLHAEVQFGFPLKTSSTVAGFENTTVTRQLSTNGGIGFGQKLSPRGRR